MRARVGEAAVPVFAASGEWLSLSASLGVCPVSPRTASPRLLHMEQLLGTIVLPQVQEATCLTEKAKRGEILVRLGGRELVLGASGLWLLSDQV